MPWSPICKVLAWHVAVDDRFDTMNGTDFDFNLLRGLALILLIVAFGAMWIWAWSDKRKDDFKKMSELPLEEDQGIVPDADSDAKRSKE